MPLSKRERHAIALKTSSAKRELADFYQRRVSILDRDVLISLSLIPIMIALLSAFCSGAGLKPDEVKAVVLIGAIGSMGLLEMFRLIHVGRAAGWRDAYHTEWKTLFGSSEPYPLHSFLLKLKGAKKTKRQGLRRDRSPK